MIQKVSSAAAVLVCLAVLNRVIDHGSFGIFSLYVTFQLAISVLDLGLGTSASREFARPMTTESWDRHLWVYEVWAHLLPALLVAGALPLILTASLRTDPLHAATAALAMVALAIEMPTRVYLGVILARGGQASAALLIGCSDLVRWSGAIWVGLATGSALGAVAWQIVVVLGLSGVLRRRVRRRLPFKVPEGGWALLRRVGRVSLLPLAIATLAGAGRLYADRVFATHALSLSHLGIYTTSFASMGVLTLLSTQLSAALLPRFAAQHAVGHWHGSLPLFVRANLVVGLLTTLGAGLVLTVAQDFVVEALGFEGGRAQLMVSILPLAVISAVLAALSGPAYSLVAAQGRFFAVAIINLAGLMLAVAALAAATPTTGIGLGRVAVLTSAVVAASLAAMLWDRRFTRSIRLRLLSSQSFLFGWLVLALHSLGALGG